MLQLQVYKYEVLSAEVGIPVRQKPEISHRFLLSVHQILVLVQIDQQIEALNLKRLLVISPSICRTYAQCALRLSSRFLVIWCINCAVRL